MKTYRYSGAEGNLGRYGFVKPGDILSMTELESRHIQGDKRFTEVDAAKAKLPPLPTDPKAKADEEERRLSVAQRNTAVTPAAELAELGRPELLQRIQALRSAGYQIDVKESDDKKTLIRAITEVTALPPEPKTEE